MDNTTTGGHKSPLPPYMSYGTFRNLIESWRGNLHQRIDRSVLATHSGATQSWMLATLRYFKLTEDDGTPTALLERLVRADGPDRQAFLMELLHQGYSFMFDDGFDVAKATPAQINGLFAATGAHGSTLKKCVSFFGAMAKDAGLELTPLLRRRQRRASNGRTKRRPPANMAPDGTKSGTNLHAADARAAPSNAVPEGFERLPIPGLSGAYIQYPADLTESQCTIFEAMIGVLLTSIKVREGKEGAP